MRDHAGYRVAGIVLTLGALGASGVFGVSGGGTPAPPDAAAAKVLAAARAEVGDAYRYGGTGPQAWDCSGLTYMAWRTVGGVTAIPRTSREQQAWALPVRPADARPGDLVFFGDPVNHVGLYLGNGRIIDASSSKGRVVERAIWTSGVIRYGRVPRRGPAPPAPAVATAPQPIPPVGHAAPTTKEMAAFVRALRTRVGAGWAARSSGPRYDAAGAVRWAWARAGYGVLPPTPAAIERLTRPVALEDLRVGDLIFYGAPAVHVAVYVGNGEMIDASKVLHRVSQRRVFASVTVRFARLVPRKS